MTIGTVLLWQLPNEHHYLLQLMYKVFYLFML